MKAFRLFLALVVAGLVGGIRLTEGYTFEAGPTGHDLTWPNGIITLNLQISPTKVPYPNGQNLQDGSTSWNEVAQAAAADWNPYLVNVQFVTNTNTSAAPANNDGVNSVFFAASSDGYSFGADALAVTMIRFHNSTSTIAETDVVVNTAYIWDSYRGPLEHSVGGTYHYDIRRVLDHEFGHILGLNHPDLATPAQNVVSIMNSTIGDLDHIELDDIEGAMILYGQKTVLALVSVASNPPAGGTVTGSGNFAIGSTQQVTATANPYYEFVKWEDNSTNPTRTITTPVQGGAYTATFQLTMLDWQMGLSSVTPNQLIFARGQFYAYTNSGIYTSPDGATWTHRSSVQMPYIGGIAYGNNVFVIVSNTTIYTSTDGLTWTMSATLANPEGLIVYGNGLFLVEGGVVDGAPTSTYVSYDGIHWTTYSGPVGYGVNAMTYGNGYFVLEGYQDNVGTISAISRDGQSWVTGSFPEIPVRTITYGNGLFVMAGVNNILTSTDGLHWQAVTYPNSTSYQGYVNGLGYGSGFFIATGSYQTIYSADGINWTAETSTLPNGNTVLYGNGRFVGTTENGLVQSGAVLPLAGAPTLPTISSGLFVRSAPGASLTYQISAAQATTAFNASNLPAGLSVDVQTGAITGTPSGTGTFPITIYATNDAGTSLATLTLALAAAPSPVSFNNWMQANGVAGGAAAAPAGDGVPNLLRYVFDTTPTGTLDANDRAALPVLGTTPDKEALTLTFRENQVLTGYLVGVETCSDLKTWSAPSYAEVTATGSYDPSTGDPMMQAKVPITSQSQSQFIRLVVTPQ